MSPRTNHFTIGLLGGFGNNLHQIALGKHLENLGQKVKYDLSLIPSTSLILQIPQFGEYLTKRKLKIGGLLPSPYGKYRFAAIWLRRFLGPNRMIVSTKAADKVDLSFSTGAWLYGYWQRLEYSESLIAELKDIFGSDKPKECSVKIHIRRGDFKGTPSYLENDFYVIALQALLNSIEGPLPPVFLVSDDLDLDLNQFNFPVKITNLNSQSTRMDFEALVNSSYVITSRSTFSWWAARISNGTVLFPSPWDLDSEDDSQIPKTWIPIRW